MTQPEPAAIDWGGDGIESRMNSNYVLVVTESDQILSKTHGLNDSRGFLTYFPEGRIEVYAVNPDQALDPAHPASVIGREYEHVVIDLYAFPWNSKLTRQLTERLKDHVPREKLRGLNGVAMAPLGIHPSEDNPGLTQLQHLLSMAHSPYSTGITTRPVDYHAF